MQIIDLSNSYYCENDLVAPRVVLPIISKNNNLYKSNKISDNWQYDTVKVV